MGTYARLACTLQVHSERLAKYLRVHMHYTPRCSSWLNQVENWLSRIQRDVIVRGFFTSIKDRGKQFMRYIRQ